MTRKKALEVLVEYFVKKGAILGDREYRKQVDAPIRPIFITRYIGPWSRIPNLIKKNYPDVYELLSSEEIPTEEPTEAPTEEPKEVKIKIPKKKVEAKDDD